LLPSLKAVHSRQQHLQTPARPAEIFYVPGSSHKSWNKEFPVLRIMMRSECRPELAGRGDPTQFAELADCTAMVAPQAQQAMMGGPGMGPGMGGYGGGGGGSGPMHTQPGYGHQPPPW
jgi:hypothetical protein